MTTDEPIERLAVYGTLAPGRRNAHVLDDVPGDWSRGTVQGTRFEDGWHGYPGLVLDGGDEVDVHVLRSRLLPEHLARLDAFEGPGYRRVVADVHLADGPPVRAWVYVLDAPPE